MAEQTSCMNDGRVSSAERTPPPIELLPSKTETEQPARANSIAAARPFGPDPTTVVFHLRPDFHFADGAPVTAADVRATYEAVLDPALASPKRAALAMLSQVEAPDAHTVVMRLQ